MNQKQDDESYDKHRRRLGTCTETARNINSKVKAQRGFMKIYGTTVNRMEMSLLRQNIQVSQSQLILNYINEDFNETNKNMIRCLMPLIKVRF